MTVILGNYQVDVPCASCYEKRLKKQDFRWLKPTAGKRRLNCSWKLIQMSFCLREIWMSSSVTGSRFSSAFIRMAFLIRSSLCVPADYIYGGPFPDDGRNTAAPAPL